jgi:acetylornithine deacetylase
MKGSLAAMLAAVELREADARLAGDLILTGVADGNMPVLAPRIFYHYRADAAIVTEPADLVISTAHRGFAWYEVETTGRAAHGSRYQEGIDAILHMGRFLAELDHLEQEVRRRPPHPLVGPPSLHTALISGGVENSTYPPSCFLQIERRTCPGETPANPGRISEIITGWRGDPQFRAVCSLHAAGPSK